MADSLWVKSMGLGKVVDIYFPFKTCGEDLLGCNGKVGGEILTT